MELWFSVFPQPWGATLSSHFSPPVTGRSARGRKGSQLFQLVGETSSAARTEAETVEAKCFYVYIHPSFSFCFYCKLNLNKLKPKCCETLVFIFRRTTNCFDLKHHIFNLGYSDDIIILPYFSLPQLFYFS